jgi:hypothetical protein
MAMVQFLEGAQKLKWAASQEAVTLPWLSAHSIRTGIGGDISIVILPSRLSRINFHQIGHFVAKDSAPKCGPSLTLPRHGVSFIGFRSGILPLY